MQQYLICGQHKTTHVRYKKKWNQTAVSNIQRDCSIDLRFETDLDDTPQSRVVIGTRKRAKKPFVDILNAPKEGGIIGCIPNFRPTQIPNPHQWKCLPMRATLMHVKKLKPSERPKIDAISWLHKLTTVRTTLSHALHGCLSHMRFTNSTQSTL